METGNPNRDVEAERSREGGECVGSLARSALALAWLVLLLPGLLGGSPPTKVGETDSTARARVAEIARQQVGVPDAQIGGRPYRDDCLGFVEGCLAVAGFGSDERDGSTAQWLWPIPSSEAAVGDFAVFRDTYDRNGNGLRDDLATHIGIVVSVGEAGQYTLVHRSDGVVRMAWMDLASPNVHIEPEGFRVANSTLRTDGEDRLAAQLLQTFARWSGPSPAGAVVLSGTSRSGAEGGWLDHAEEARAEVWRFEMNDGTIVAGTIVFGTDHGYKVLTLGGDEVWLPFAEMRNLEPVEDVRVRRRPESVAAPQTSSSTSVGCTKDTDCKGDRICENSRCTEPRTGTERTAPTVSRPSVEDKERLEELLNLGYCGNNFHAAKVKDYGVKCLAYRSLDTHHLCEGKRTCGGTCDGTAYKNVVANMHWDEMDFVHLVVGSNCTGWGGICVAVSANRCITMMKDRALAVEVADLVARIGGVPRLDDRTW